jgi:hypothetical protein
MRSRVAATALSTCVLLSACGGDTQPSSPPDERPAVEAAARAWIDGDRCDLLSDRYAKEGFETVAAGRGACEEEKDPGIRRGQYDVVGVTSRGSVASATLRLKDGGERTYRLVKGGSMGWQIDGREERFRARIGQPLRVMQQFEIDGRESFVDARVTVGSVRVLRRLRDRYQDQAIRTPGQKFVRARVTVKSVATKRFTFLVNDFSVVDSRGQTATEAGTATFTPYLRGTGTPSLAPGETIRGYVSFQLPIKSAVKEIRFGGGSTATEPRIWAAD